MIFLSPFLYFNRREMLPPRQSPSRLLQSRWPPSCQVSSRPLPPHQQPPRRILPVVHPYLETTTKMNLTLTSRSGKKGWCDQEKHFDWTVIREGEIFFLFSRKYPAQLPPEQRHRDWTSIPLPLAYNIHLAVEKMGRQDDVITIKRNSVVDLWN